MNFNTFLVIKTDARKIEISKNMVINKISVKYALLVRRYITNDKPTTNAAHKPAIPPITLNVVLSPNNSVLHEGHLIFLKFDTKKNFFKGISLLHFGQFFMILFLKIKYQTGNNPVFD